MKVLAGAPNLVRGGSHSGNVSASALAAAGCLDVLSSDYVPASLLQAALSLAEGRDSLGLPAAVAMVSANPADVAGLADRGRIAVGRRADLVLVHQDAGLPVVRQVWRAGVRVI
jgi:alpha-D-ribose 1-methylphosphonate 5-triphosphate diphosphatase